MYEKTPIVERSYTQTHQLCILLHTWKVGSFPMCVDGVVQIWLLLALWFYWWGFPFCVPSHYLPSFENSDVPSIIVNKNSTRATMSPKSWWHVSCKSCVSLFLYTPIFTCTNLCATNDLGSQKVNLGKEKTSFWTWLVVWHHFIKLSSSMVPNWPSLYVLYWWVFDYYYGWMIKINLSF